MVFADGVESMSRVKMGATGSDELYPELDEKYGMGNLAMGATAEKVAEKYDISREAQDEFGLRSQQRAHEATETGRFRDELVPIKTDDGPLATDESI